MQMISNLVIFISKEERLEWKGSEWTNFRGRKLSGDVIQNQTSLDLKFQEVNISTKHCLILQPYIKLSYTVSYIDSSTII